MLRYVAGTDELIYPIGYIQCKNPMNKKLAICSYTAEGRAEIHDSLRINKRLMIKRMRQPLYGRNCEYVDNHIALFSAQSGKCAVTGQEFADTSEIHCHHKVPKHMDGTIEKYKTICDLNKENQQSSKACWKRRNCLNWNHLSNR